MKKILNDKKERILKLEKGSFDIFSKALQGHLGTDVKPEQPEVPEKPRIMYTASTSSSTSRKKKKYQKKPGKSSREQSESCTDVSESELEEVGDIEQNYLDLDILEVCRICLQNDGSLMSLHKRHKQENHTNAELVEYSLGIQVSFSRFPGFWKIIPNFSHSRFHRTTNYLKRSVSTVWSV